MPYTPPPIHRFVLPLCSRLSRQQAAFPMPVADKYWPTVSKIDDAFGDRNLVCVLEK